MFLGMYPMEMPDIPDDVEVWSANEAYELLPEARKPDRIFQMHPRDWREEERRFLRQTPEHDCFGRNAEHVEYLRTCGVPVYGHQVWDDIPTSVRYPFEAVTAAVGVPLPPDGKRRLWATSTWGYMAALLLKECFVWRDVGGVWLQGVELPRGHEPGAALGVAESGLLPRDDDNARHRDPSPRVRFLAALRSALCPRRQSEGMASRPLVVSRCRGCAPR